MNSWQDQLEDLKALKPNWDSYGGVPITKTSLHVARRICENSDPVPLQIVPTSAGGIQLEWDYPWIQYEIEISPDGSLSILATSAAKDWWERKESIEVHTS